MKRVLFFVFGILLCLGIYSQELKVKSFTLAATDISAQTQQRKDLNDEPCALVKVQFVGDILYVEGNVIKPLVKKGNETWAYMTHGSQQMKVLTKDYLPIMVDFSNYGISQVEKNKTYVLVLTKPTGGAESVMQQCQTLIIRYTPSTATVLVDNKMVRGNNGVAKTILPVGQHSFVVACDGYESEEGMVKLKASAPSNLQITLTKDAPGVGVANSGAESQHTSANQSSRQNQISSVSTSASSNNSGYSSGSFPVPSGNNTISIPVKNGIIIEMVKVESGEFLMGATAQMAKPSRDEKPCHSVTLTQNYYIGKYEVTQDLWKSVMSNNPSDFIADNLPVNRVSWIECQEFISRLNKMTGKNFRLPTEAEWEFAARGGNKSKGYQYSGSNNIFDVAWFDGNSKLEVQPVGSKLANELGIYDMSGNVAEWCQDRKGKYDVSQKINPVGPLKGKDRIIRGGSYGTNDWSCRISSRPNFEPEYNGFNCGLRLALSE